MADEGREVALADAENRNVPGSDLARYKYMISILMPSRLRGMYLKPIEHITPDAKVPFQRIIVALMGIAAVVIGGIKIGTDVPSRLPYVFTPIMIIILSVFVMLVIYMLSSRSKSMLASVVDFNLFKIIESGREKKGMNFNSIGIKSIDKKGLIKFDNGDVGVAYSVRGQLSNSTLPVVANYIDGIRAQYYVTRTPGSQEIRITSIEPNELEVQRKDLSRKIEGYQSADNYGDSWRAEMCSLQRDYIDSLVKEGTQLTMLQTVILRDINNSELNRSIRAFESVARGSMYERFFPIEDRDELISRLGGVAMMSTAVG